jgi:hypothetical protein
LFFTAIPATRLVLHNPDAVQLTSGQVRPDQADRLFEVDVLRAPQGELLAGRAVVADSADHLCRGCLANVGTPAPRLVQFPAQVFAVMGGPRDQEAAGAGHLERDARPVGEADRPLDAAPGEPGAQLVGLDRFEQARGPSGGL